MPFITTPDGAEIFYKDWGTGQPVVFSHGWPLNADSWDGQSCSSPQRLPRVAHDRRGHGRSTQTWHGNDMDTYADDLAAVIEALDLRDVMLVGFSTGGGEVARYIGRHGTARVAGAVLVSAVPPFMVQDRDNPGGVPIEVFDEHPRRLAGRPLAAVPRPRRRTVLRQQPARRRHLRRAHATRSGCKACSPATTTPTTRIAAFSATDMRPTCDRSTSRRSSSTATTIRSCRSPSAARRRPRSSPGAG